MLITDTVKIRTFYNKKLDFYKQLGYNTEEDFIEIKIEHLNQYSNVIVNAVCDYCGVNIDVQYKKYTASLSKCGKFACSKKCSFLKSQETNISKYGSKFVLQNDNIKEKGRNTNIKKYGVDNPSKSKYIRNKTIETNLSKYGFEYGFQNEEIKNKIKQTNLEKYGFENVSKDEKIRQKAKQTTLQRYGVENILQNEEFKEKFKSTLFKKYGVEHALQNGDILNKLKQTNLERYGVENILQNEDFKEKIKQTNLEKYGVENPFQNEDFKEKIKQTNLEKYGVLNIYQNEEFRKHNFDIAKHPNYINYSNEGVSIFYCDCGGSHEFEIKSHNFHKRKESNLPLCTICYPIDDLKSIKEKQILEFIQSIYSGKILPGYRDSLEIDIYLPDLNLGFEFNGLYWHSNEFKEKDYHLNKTIFFKEKDIRIIHIFEDDWDIKKDIIKSQIKNLLGLTENKIFARKCQVKEITDAKDFLKNNHIQGNVNSIIKLGLYYNEELVSVMTFDNFEGRKKMKEKEWNLNRFCNKLNYNVIGGASKLLKYFIKNYNPTRIISYADRIWSNGNLYYQLGFKLVNTTKPDYKYIINGVRKHKSNFKKSKLDTTLTESQEMNNKGINKIYDCGKLKFELI